MGALMKDNLTDWYPPHIKPVRVGVYIASKNGSNSRVLRYWNGRIWSWSWDASTSQESVKTLKNLRALDQNMIHWKGLKNVN